MLTIDTMKTGQHTSPLLKMTTCKTMR